MRLRHQKLALAFLRKKLAVNRIQDGSKTLTQVVRRVGLARQELTERMKRAGV